MPVELSIDQRALRDLGRALRREADGKRLRRDLIRELKKPLLPAVAEIKSGLMSIGAGGLGPGGEEPLRPAVARRIKTEAKLSGRAVGVRVRARRTPAVREFANAPKRLNRARGWRHRVYGTSVWVHQVGKPGYFDDPLQHRRREFRSAVIRAMNDAARRIHVSLR